MPYEYGNLVPLYFTKKGAVLIAVNRNKLFVYNPNKMSQREIHIPSDCYKIHVASYAKSLASPVAYGHEEDWVEESKDARELVDYALFCWSCCYDYYDRDWELLNIIDMEDTDEEDNNWVWNGF